MRRSRKIAASALAGTLLATAFGVAGASAEDVSVTAALTQTDLGGTRVLSAVGPLAPLTNVAGETTMSTPMTVAVVETLAAGVSPWSVKAEMTGVLTGQTSGETIANSNLSLGGCTVTDLLGLIAGNSVTASSLDTAQDLSAQRDVFAITGEATSTLYTNTYSCTPTLSLDLPGMFTADTYKGTLQVTLHQ